MINFTADYCIAVFISAFGILQFAFSLGGLRGVLFFKFHLASRIIGLALAILGFSLYFGTGTRNINDYEGGLDAPDQALYFSLSALAALAATLAFTSLVNHRMKNADSDPDAGVDVLRSSNYASALRRSVQNWCRNWRTQTKRYFSG